MTRKCCKKCMYRHGSPERRDQWTWLFYQDEDRNENRTVMYCHESVPDHYQEEKDGSPRWRMCNGWLATKHLPMKTLMRRTKLDEIKD